MKLTFLIAWRHLRAPRYASFTRYASILAMIGLGMGIAALILTFGILAGFEHTLSAKIARFDGHIRIQHFMDTPLSTEDPALDTALVNAGVLGRVSSFIQKPALLRVGSRAEGVLVEAFQDNFQRPGLQEILMEGTPDLAGATVIIGRELARNLNLSLGDKLVLFDMAGMTNITSSRRLGQYRITGIYHSGLQEYDKTMVYMSLTNAQKLFGLNQLASGQVIYLDSNADMDQVIRKLNSRLGYPYFVLSWKDKHRTLFQWMAVQKWPILIIFSMIALVGLVNIVSALAMIILEKVREIGLLTALGLSRRRIRNVFIIEGGLIGLAGSLGGTLAALGMAWAQERYGIFPIPEDVYFMEQIPVDLSPVSMVLFILVGSLAAVAASLAPARKVIQLDAARALRYE